MSDEFYKTFLKVMMTASFVSTWVIWIVSPEIYEIPEIIRIGIFMIGCISVGFLAVCETIERVHEELLK